MKTKIVISVFLIISIQAEAECYGNGFFKTCYDDAGNTYTIQKYGNITYVDGYNPNNGSRWNETAQKIGNFTFIDGKDSNGNNWNETIQTYGSTTFIDGKDSNGNSFSKTCINGFCD